MGNVSEWVNICSWQTELGDLPRSKLKNVQPQNQNYDLH